MMRALAPLLLVLAAGSAAASPGLPDDGRAAVRDLLSGRLAPAEVDAAMRDPATVSRVADLLRRAKAGAPGDWTVDIAVSAGDRGRRVAWVSLRRRGTLERSSPERRWREPSWTTVSEVGLRLDPPEPRTAVARTEPQPAPSAPPEPDAVPSERAPCPPGDDACWRRSTLRALDRRPPACEPYVAELDAHLRRIDRDPDPNGRPAPAAVPDLDAPAREADARVRDWASPYPDGAIVQGSDGFARRDVRVTNAPPAPPPTPARPSDGCRAEWSDAAIAAVPTLACTRELVDDAHWRGSDGLVKAAEAPFSPIGSLPLVGRILATKARQVAADRSWMSIFALRWMDRLVAARQRGDAGYLDRAFAGLADRPDERRALADHLRRWLSSPSWSAWHGAIRAVYEERFASLYPAAADEAGMPALSRFPTRMWWATNWLSAAVRRGLSADDAAGLLRCGPDAGPGADVMRDLGPMLATDPRFGRLAADLAARL